MTVTVNIAEEMVKWQRRTIFLSAFGFVGVAAIVGAGAIYISQKIESHFRLQYIVLKKLHDEIDGLRSEVAALSETVNTPTKSATVPISSVIPKKEKRSVDDEEYLTADEESEDEVSRETTKSVADTTGDNEYIFFTRIDNLLEGSMDQQHIAYESLQENITNVNFRSAYRFWWRLAKATHFEATIAESLGNKPLKQKHHEDAYTYAQKGVDLNGNSANTHKWLAITCGARSEYLGINDKIQSGYVFKEHVDRAISLDPSDPTCYYLLGRFCLEVSMLSWIERKVAATLFSAPPSSTPEEALDCFKKSENLKPFMDNRFYMAKCYHTQGDNFEAIRWLDLAASMPANTATDKVSLANVQELRRKIGLLERENELHV